ncbi:MAG: hypothetical protein ACPG47_01225 [Leucothrix sp.]
MFEAHFAEPEDFQGLATVTHSWSKTYYRRHKRSFQPLRIWFAWGRRKVKGVEMQRRLFIYIEYQDMQNHNQYCCLEIAKTISIEQAIGLAINVDLGQS